MLKIFLTSDTHFYHKNVIKYDKRPFNNVDEMNDNLINNWNNIVDKDDMIIHVGDFCWAGTTVMRNLLAKLNGIKVLLRGNHDKKSVGVYESAGFYCCENHMFVKDMFIGHYPVYKDDFIPEKWIDSWYKDYKQMIIDSGVKKIIHGHVHNNDFIADENFNHFNVGVCNHNYSPISMIDIVKYFETYNNEGVVNGKM